jgi:hypothetical protein
MPSPPHATASSPLKRPSGPAPLKLMSYSGRAGKKQKLSDVSFLPGTT